MRAVILAAGVGSRLRGTGFTGPKWLHPVGDRSIADRQLDALHDLGVPVTVVTGHAADAVDRYAAGRGVSTLHNPCFAELNNWYSVDLALREVEDDHLLIVNSDLCAPVEWYVAAVRALADAATTDPAALVVDLDRRLTDESMKVAATGDRLRDIAKVGLDGDPVGEYVGLLSVRGPARAAYREQLDAFAGDPQRANEWYEKAVALTARAHRIDWRIVPTPDGSWVEVDDEDDLAAAARLGA